MGSSIAALFPVVAVATAALSTRAVLTNAVAKANHVEEEEELLMATNLLSIGLPIDPSISKAGVRQSNDEERRHH